MKNQLLVFAVFIAATMAFTGCASLTGFQDGRTLGKDGGEFGVSLNFSQSPDFDELEEQAEDSLTMGFPSLVLPSFEFAGRYGVAEKVDLGVRLNTNLNLGISGKFQVVGDQESTFALALGAEVGTFGLVSGLWNVQVPVFMSVHPSERLSIYFSPRYIYQFSSFAGAENGLSYLGGNAGLMFGSRNKYGIDVGYYDVSAGSDSGNLGLLQIGLGARFPIGSKSRN